MRDPYWYWSEDRSSRRYDPDRHRRYGRGYTGRNRSHESSAPDRETSAPDRETSASRSKPPALVSRTTDPDDRAIDLRDTTDRVRIATELPDCSRDRIRVWAVGSRLRIRAVPSDEGDGIDRTITLGEIPADAQLDVTYDGSTLRVDVPKAGRER